MFYLHIVLGPTSHPRGQEEEAFWGMPADSRVEVDPDGNKASVSQVHRTPVGLPGAHLAQGVVEQNQISFSWSAEQIHVCSSRGR